MGSNFGPSGLQDDRVVDRVAMKVPRGIYATLALLLILQSSLLVWSARVHSPTWDEPAYLVAGISHWKFGRFDLCSVNPPLIRVIASAPVYFLMNPEVNWNLYSTDPAQRSEVLLGRAFIEDNGFSAVNMLFAARLMILPIALIGTLLCFFLARDLFGNSLAGLVAACLWALSPDVLAYGSVITADLASAVAGLAVSYSAFRLIRNGSWNRTIELGTVTGVALLCKSIWLVLPIVFLVLWLAIRYLPILFSVREGNAYIKPQIARMGGLTKLVVASVVAILIVNAFYGFQGVGIQLKNYKLVSQLGSGNIATVNKKAGQVISTTVLPTHWGAGLVSKATATKKSDKVESTLTQVRSADEPHCPACQATEDFVSALGSSIDCEACKQLAIQTTSDSFSQVPIGLPGNRFQKSALGNLPVPLPQRYVEGVDIQRRDFESGMRRPEWASYFAGNWKLGGWLRFYWVGLLFKTPIAALLLLVSALACCMFWKLDPQQRAGLLCLGLPAVAVMSLLTINTGLNRYLRYALPVLPLMMIFAAGFARTLTHAWAGGQTFRVRLVTSVIALLMLTYAGTSLSVAPHWFSYFNSMAGGPERGYRWFTDSNVDWGQDLLFAKEWLERHPEAKSNLNLAFFGSYSPAGLGVKYQIPHAFDSAVSSKLSMEQNRSGPLPGWYVISKNYLIGHPKPIASQDGSLSFFNSSALTYFQAFTPVDRIGYSMLVYHLSKEDVNQFRTQLGLSLLPTAKNDGNLIVQVNLHDATP